MNQNNSDYGLTLISVIHETHPHPASWWWVRYDQAQTHTRTHIFLSAAIQHHTHTHLQYTLNTAWRTAVFGPDAVFWLSLTRPNTTSCCTPDIQPLMIEYHFKRNSIQRNKHSVIILFQTHMNSFNRTQKTMFRSMSQLLFSKILYNQNRMCNFISR